MTKRTQEEINLQIEGLLKMKETLPEFSFFGDKNWENIDIQIEILKGDVKSDSLWEDESAEEFEEGDNDLYYSAIDAEQWLNNEREEDLFEI